MSEGQYFWALWHFSSFDTTRHFVPLRVQWHVCNAHTQTWTNNLASGWRHNSRKLTAIKTYFTSIQQLECQWNGILKQTQDVHVTDTLNSTVLKPDINIFRRTWSRLPSRHLRDARNDRWLDKFFSHVKRTSSLPATTLPSINDHWTVHHLLLHLSVWCLIYPLRAFLIRKMKFLLTHKILIYLTVQIQRRFESKKRSWHLWVIVITDLLIYTQNSNISKESVTYLLYINPFEAESRLNNI